MYLKLIPAAVAAIALSSTIAFGAATERGTVQSWNAKTNTLILTNGAKFMLTAVYRNANTFKVGERVIVTYDRKNGEKVATTIMITSN